MAPYQRLKDAFSRAARRVRRRLAVPVSAGLIALAATTGYLTLGPSKGMAGPDAPLRDSVQRLEEVFDTNCFVLGSENPQDRHKALRQAVADLEKLPLTGRPLVQAATAIKLNVCHIDELPAGMGAQYLPSKDAAVLPEKGGREWLALTMAHELLHGLQDAEKLLSYYYSWSINTRVERHLTIEAAAAAMELMVALEAKNAGDKRYWDYLNTHISGTFADKELFTLATAAHDAAIAGGKTPGEALDAAGLAAWQRLYVNDFWLNFYLNAELVFYATDIGEGKITHAWQIVSGVPADQRDLAGKFSDRPGFTAGTPLPALQDLLKRNTKMRHAYEAVEIYRLTKVMGAEDETVTARTAAAQAAGNPYLGLDIDAAVEQTKRASWSDAGVTKKYMYLYDALDQMNALRAKQAPAPARVAPNAHPSSKNLWPSGHRRMG